MTQSNIYNLGGQGKGKARSTNLITVTTTEYCITQSKVSGIENCTGTWQRIWMGIQYKTISQWPDIHKSCVSFQKSNNFFNHEVPLSKVSFLKTKISLVIDLYVRNK